MVTNVASVTLPLAVARRLLSTNVAMQRVLPITRLRPTLVVYMQLKSRTTHVELAPRNIEIATMLLSGSYFRSVM